MDAFLEYSALIGSPEIFRKWAALSAIAGALQRRVWTTSFRGTTYPHLYVILVGAAASGKTQASSHAISILAKVESTHIAPNSLSRASMMDALAGAGVTIPRKGEIVVFNSMTIHAEELGVLIPAYDAEIMAHLTQIYDGKPYIEHKRGNDLKLFIEHPQFNLLADCTPSYLAETLPTTAWEQGFMSRCCLIYSGSTPKTPIGVKTRSGNTAGIRTDPTRGTALARDLCTIGKLFGEVLWDDDAGALYETWHMTDGRPWPTHPRLQSYRGRRTVLLAKIALICAVSRRDFQYIIMREDYVRALNIMIEAEHVMPDIFLAMTGGGDAIAMNDTWDWITRETARTGNGVAHAKALAFIAQRIPGHSVARVLELMVDSKMIRQEVNERGQKVYHPADAQLH